MQSRVHLNHDVSYFVHFSRWLLQGRTLGSDLHDGNLPMVWGLFMPSAALVQSNLLDEPTAVRVVFWAYFLDQHRVVDRRVVTAGAAATALPRSGWVVAFVLVATLGPGFSFGQREHACVLFAMPYLAAAVLRLQGGQIPRKSIAICIGVLAGIGFALKPYFLAIPALVELLLLARLGWRSLLVRVESLVLGLTVLAYVVTAVLLIPDYLKFTIGLTRSTYWAYDSANFPVHPRAATSTSRNPLCTALLIALVTRTWSRQHTVMLLAGLGYSVSYFVQSKGFVYHAYPVLVCSVTFLGICLGRGLTRAWTDGRAAGTGSVLRWCLRCAARAPAHQAGSRRCRALVLHVQHRVRDRPVSSARRSSTSSTILPRPGSRTSSPSRPIHSPDFRRRPIRSPSIRAGPLCSHFIPAYARLDEVTDPTARGSVVRAAEYQRRTVVEDFERRPPSIVFAEGNRARLGMNGRQFDDIAFYLADPRFQKNLGELRGVPADGSLARVRSSRDRRCPCSAEATN